MTPASLAAPKKLSANDVVGAEAHRSRGRPKMEDVAALENKLLSAALKGFLKDGYGGASLNKIVAAAGVSKTTLYSRFTSKEDLFRAIIYQQIGRLAPTMRLESQGEPLDLEQGLVRYANRALEVSLKGDVLAINRLIFSESHRFPELGAAAAERSKIGAKQVAEFIRGCATAARVNCNDPDGAADAFILMLRGWYINTILTNQKVTSAERKQWVDRAVHALLSDWRKW